MPVTVARNAVVDQIHRELGATTEVFVRVANTCETRCRSRRTHTLTGIKQVDVDPLSLRVATGQNEVALQRQIVSVDAIQRPRNTAQTNNERTCSNEQTLTVAM